MKAEAATPSTTEEHLVKHYLGQLAQLSPDARLEVIARLSRTLKGNPHSSSPRVAANLPDFVGAWAEDEEADKLEYIIRQSRHFTSKP